MTEVERNLHKEIKTRALMDTIKYCGANANKTRYYLHDGTIKACIEFLEEFGVTVQRETK